jgi:hypothetical protein
MGAAALRSRTGDAQADSLAQRAEIQRQMMLAVSQQNRLVDLRINPEIDADVFAGKQPYFRNPGVNDAAVDAVARLRPVWHSDDGDDDEQFHEGEGEAAA